MIQYRYSKERGKNKMKIYEKIGMEIKLTSEEEQALLKARDIIDTLIENMFEHHFTLINTDSEIYDITRLHEIAIDLHNLLTIYGGE